MSLIEQIKRAAINHGMYTGNVDDNWEPADRLMFYRLCTRFHGNYTDHPTRVNQSTEFLEWLDKYNDPEYTEEPSQHKIINPGGIDLKQLTADRQPVNTEGASKQEIRKREEMVNENAIKTPQPPKPGAMPDPKKVVQQESKNELPDQSSVPPGSENRDNSNSQSNDSSEGNTNQSKNEQTGTKNLDSSEQAGDKKPESESSDEAGKTSEPVKPVGTDKPAPIVGNKPAPITKPTPIRTR